MNELKSFPCPNCGSPIHTTGADPNVTCDYCGSTVAVPQELRTETPASEPFPSPAVYVSTFQSDELVKGVAEAGVAAAGVATGVAAVSAIIPIVITVAILCMVLGVVGAVLLGVNSATMQANQIESTAMAPFAQFATAQPMPTDVPSPTSAPTAVPTPFDTPVAFSKVLYKNTFAKPSSDWNTSLNSKYTVEYKDGKYHVVVNETGGGKALWVGDTFTDMSVEADSQQNGGPNDGHADVVCRATDNGGMYSFEFDQNGDYGIYKYDGSGNLSVLEESTMDSGMLNQGQVNHIEGVCVGDTLTLILNGQPLLQVQDSDYTKGGAGLIVRTGDSSDPGVDVSFSNFLAKGK